MANINVENLIEAAFAVRELAYAPYSQVNVGAALLGADGRLFTGCNTENAAYGSTICAEQAAVVKAISSGCRDFAALAICGGPADQEPGAIDFFYPCGQCLQVLAEFCSPDFQVYLAISKEDYRIHNFTDLLPYAFTKKDLD